MSEEGSMNSRRGQVEEQVVEINVIGVRIDTKTTRIGRMRSTRQNSSMERNQKNRIEIDKLFT